MPRARLTPNQPITTADAWHARYLEEKARADANLKLIVTAHRDISELRKKLEAERAALEACQRGLERAIDVELATIKERGMALIDHLVTHNGFTLDMAIIQELYIWVRS